MAAAGGYDPQVGCFGGDPLAAVEGHADGPEAVRAWVAQALPALDDDVHQDLSQALIAKGFSSLDALVLCGNDDCAESQTSGSCNKQRRKPCRCG